jgi:polysaccharide biosynthesis/export protein
MTRIFLFLGVIVIFSACVPNRKYVYLQRNDLHDKNLPKDSVVRVYQQQAFDYKIQPNDALYIRFQSLTPQEYDFFQEAGVGNTAGNRNFEVTSELVDAEGMILFPVIGKYKVAGMTVFQVQDSLQSLAAKYLESAVVKVRLVNFRFTVLGEVAQEGTVTSFSNRVSIVEAIGLAGGLGELANRSDIKIIRQKNGITEVGYVNLLDEKLLESPFYYVNQNDVLIVPALKQRPFRKYFGQNFTLLVSTISLVLLVVNLTK